jgi:hypothetical protein
VRAVADEVAATVDLRDAELVDPFQRRLQRGEVGVDVGDDGDGVGVGDHLEQLLEQVEYVVGDVPSALRTTSSVKGLRDSNASSMPSGA